MSDTPAPSSPVMSIGGDVGQVAQALAAVFNFADHLNAILNSPTMIAARQRADVQALLNKQDADMSAAHKTGDLTQINRDESG